MNLFKAGDRVYHIKENDPEGYEGFCIILEVIDRIHAKVTWEDSEQENVVEIRHLWTEEEARKKNFV